MSDVSDTGTVNGLVEEVTAYVAQLQAENASLRSLCETLLETYRLGAVTGEGADKFWCREMYDRGMCVLRELRAEVDG